MRCVLVLSLLALHPGRVFADPVRVADGDFYAPQFSPDGASLLVTGSRMHGLSVVDIDSGRARSISDEPRAGVTARYLADGRIAFEARRAGALRTVALDDDGVARRADLAKPIAFAHGDKIYVRTADGIVPVDTGDRCFAPTMSPDGTRVAFIGLSTGIYVYDLATGALEHLGAGTAPAWSPDSRKLAFERTEDDGHEIVGSNIYVWETGAAPVALMDTDRVIERRPSWSPDGTSIAYDDDRGAVYVVSAEVSR